MIKRMPVSQARRAFPDLINQAFYAGETTIVTRRGKGDVAAIVPMNILGAGHILNAQKTFPKSPRNRRRGRAEHPQNNRLTN
jgi:hypothetical protein